MSVLRFVRQWSHFKTADIVELTVSMWLGCDINNRKYACRGSRDRVCLCFACVSLLFFS